MFVTTINVRGMAHVRKQRQIASTLKTFPSDIFLLQETFINNVKKESTFSKEWDGEMHWSWGSSHRGGVGIIWKNTADIKFIDKYQDTEGRVLSVLLKYGVIRINVMTVYAPVDVTERKSFFRDLPKYFFGSAHLVLGGDFNCVLSIADTTATSHQNLEGGKELETILRNKKLIDVWKQKHTRYQGTWASSNRTITSRLDRIYVPREWCDCIKKSDIMPCFFSDHDFVTLAVELEGIPLRARGLWRLNNTFLKDDDFQWLIKHEIATIIKNRNGENILAFWDRFKNRIKKVAKSHGIAKAKRERLTMAKLVRNVIKTKTKIWAGDITQSDKLIDLEKKLAERESKKLEDIRVRSRAKWFEQNEKPTAYFFSVACQRHDSNQMAQIGVDVGQKDKLEAVKSFYVNLFKLEKVDSEIQDVLLSKVKKKISAESFRRCEGTFTSEEICTAMKQLTRNKTPGNDGFTLEFYVVFWSEIELLFGELIYEILQKNELPCTARQSIIRLVFKKGDKTDLKNWRPIALLNADYKIIAKCLSNRLKFVLSDVLAHDQTCSVPGRSISDNLNLLRDSLDFINITNENAILISLDQEKAFDRIDRGFLDKVLRNFGFGSIFCGWVAALYKGANARIIVNGELTEEVQLLKGIRQGCPLSPLLYVLVAEVLAVSIREENRIKCLLLPGANGLCYKVRQYADDLSSIVKDSRSLEILFDVVGNYESATGARLNKQKSEAMWLGAWRARPEKPYGLKWVTKMKVLGVWFGDCVEDENWNPKVEKMRRALDRWRGRGLSIWGRVLIIKVLGVSNFEYLARVIPLPRSTLKKFERLVWTFVWKGRIEPVKRRTCQLSVVEGGLGMVDMKLRARALRVDNLLKILNKPDQAPWYMVRYFVGRGLAHKNVRWKYLLSNMRPNAGRPTEYYELVMSDLDNFDVPVVTTVKEIYKVFLSEVTVLPRCHGIWQHSVGETLPWPRIWSGLLTSITAPRKN